MAQFILFGLFKIWGILFKILFVKFDKFDQENYGKPRMVSKLVIHDTFCDLKNKFNTTYSFKFYLSVLMIEKFKNIA